MARQTYFSILKMHYSVVVVFALSHRIKATRRSAIARLHPVAMVFAVAVEACSPCPALLVEVLLGGFAAFAVVDRASAVIGAHAGSVDVVIDGYPLG